MGKIVQLDQDTINKIAAGEVIERPAAVVKELVENAIDAKASAITIEIKDGGTSLIRITDNGSGIATEDIPLAFKSHATSKITSVEDLFAVSSLGFRGEALSSIAAVSQVELITKTHDDLYGVRYLIEGGEEKSTENIGCPEGTTFLVKNLFYNTPVRRKFLKSATTEAGYVADFVERLAVSHPNIAFKFINNGQIKMHTSGNNNIKDIIYNIYGRDIASNIISIENSSDKIMISGFVGKPIISRGNRNYENYYINGRYIKSNVIYKAIEDAYKTYTMQHKYPFVTIYLDVDGSLIDVNVHPTKMEIRFSNSSEIYEMVYSTIRDALNGNNLIPEVSLTKKKDVIKKINNAPEPFEKKRLEEQKKSVEPSVNKYMQIQATNNKIKEYRQEDNIHVDYKKNVNKVAESIDNNHYKLNKNHENNTSENKQYVKGLNNIKKSFVKDKENTNHTEETNNIKELFVKDKENTNHTEEINNIKELFVKDKENTNHTEETNNIRETFVEDKENTNHTEETDNIKELFVKDKENTNYTEETNNIRETFVEDKENMQQPDNLEDDNKSAMQVQGEKVQSTLDNENLISSNEIVGSSKVAKRADVYSNKMEQIITGVQGSIFDDNEIQNENKEKSLKIIGQVFLTYWIVEMGNKMFIIDQHAAHEKVMYEKILSGLKSKEHSSQIIAPPIIISLSLREEEVLKKNIDIFNNIGFEIDSFGGRDYTIGAVPADMYGIADKALFIELIDSLSDGDSNSTPDIVFEKIASMSCKAAVKGNSRLSMIEAEQLIRDLMKLDNPFNCPHGRPTIISLTKNELEKKFKRQL